MIATCRLTAAFQILTVVQPPGLAALLVGY